MRVYGDQDCDVVDLIKGKKVAVIGYGSRGHAHIANLKKSGVTELNVGLRPESATNKKAQAAGFETAAPAECGK